MDIRVIDYLSVINPSKKVNKQLIKEITDYTIKIRKEFKIK